MSLAAPHPRLICALLADVAVKAVGAVGACVSGMGAGSDIVPPVPAADIAAVGDTARTPVRPIGRTDVDAEVSRAVTVATTPSAIRFVFIPVSRQVRDPLPPKQLTVFEAAVPFTPVVTLIEEISLGE